MSDLQSDDSLAPQWIRTIYQRLRTHIAEREGGIDPDRAQELLSEETTGELELTRAEAEYAIQRLLERGLLYEVDGEVYVTQSDAER